MPNKRHCESAAGFYVPLSGTDEAGKITNQVQGIFELRSKEIAIDGKEKTGILFSAFPVAD